MTKLNTLSPGFDWRADAVGWPVTTDVGPGLTGVVAAGTEVMWLDPSSGQLAYRGVPVDELAGRADFEEVAHLLITGSTPDDDPEGLAEFRNQVRSSRELPSTVEGLIRDLDPETHPTRMLRAGVSAVGCHELTVEDDLSGERQWRELRVVGQTAALVGVICRHRAGREPRAPQPGCSLTEGVLAALNDRPPTAREVAALDLAWVLHAAHGFDAPTFTSMIVASCLADPYYNIVAGLSALRGPRTGGAAEAVLDQLLPLDNPAGAETWVRRTLADGGVVAGFGHRSYRMPDPRVVVLRKEVASLARSLGRPELFEVARAVEVAATEALAPRGVFINVNFYGALLFHLLGADPPLVPCLIAIGRMAGTAALVREALDGIRLYRPLSRYTGVTERHLEDRAKT
ncbi:MAG: citrate/2-methylcitrate synthase [Acidobacteria bacterium]|nr:citrate/2-methylcitrate synthase [Acidobacteriota bacterium]